MYFILTKSTPLANSLNDPFGGAVNHNNFYFLILLFTSLHVSASGEIYSRLFPFFFIEDFYIP
jgi:hypothetical protein